MNKPENDLDQTATPEEKATTPEAKPEYPGTAAVEAMIRSMKRLAKDENRRKELAMQWHVWVAEASKRWK